MAQIQLNNVNKKFGTNWVVRDFSLNVEDKEFVVLVGPSGCGKTTTLRMIAGLEEVTEGEIYIGGKMVNHLPPKDRDIAMVFQSYALYPHMNVFNNMAFGLQNRKFPKHEIKRRVTEAAEVLGIRELLKRKPKELSGGQRQRVAMGRAIVRKPQAFLFDEPLSNLDAKLRVQMRAELSKLHERLETTIVYVTHDQVEAMTLANRIIIMNEGRIMQAGKPLEVYENPKNKFVAGFIGSPSMNFIETKLVEDGGCLYIDAESFRLVIPRNLESRYRAHVNAEVIFGIRPEDINDSTFVNDIDGRDEVKAVVDVVEPIGAEVILIVTIGKHRMTARVDSRTKATVNQPITLNIDMKKMHIFNKKTREVVH